MRLQAKGLRCDIDGRTILHDVDLDLAPGTTTAIVGVNGTGKSTLLRALAGLRPAVAGQVEVGHDPLMSLTPRERARRIAFVGQEETPPEDLLVGEMIALGRTPYSRPWESGGRDERRVVLEALARVGMSEFVDRPCDALSGGERRRALLARGLAQDCPILMLDEPTNHLDIAHQHHLLTLVRALERTTVMAIHDLDLAHRYSDHVVVLHAGTVLAAGPPRDALRAEVIATAFGMHATLLTDPVAGEDHLVTVPFTTSPPRS